MPSALEEFPTPPGLELPKAEALMSIVSKAGRIGGPWSRFAKAMMTEGKLQPSWRELVILRVAWRRRCPYVLAGHKLISSHCGLTESRISMAMTGEGGQVHGGVDAALITATDELLNQGRIGGRTKKDLEEFLDEGEMVELAMLVGQYVLVSMLCETFQLVPEPGLMFGPTS